MQVADTPLVEQAIQRAQADESAMELFIRGYFQFGERNLHLTVNDARCIIACLENPRIHVLRIDNYSLHDDDAVLDVFRDGLPLCASVTTVILVNTQLGNEDLDRLRLAFYNTSITKLQLRNNDIQGQCGGKVLRDLLVGNDTLRELILRFSHHFGPEGCIGLGQGLADNHGLEILDLDGCFIGNDFLANLMLPADGRIINNSLTILRLCDNHIEGAEGGQQVSLLLQPCFPALKVLKLDNNNLGPLGARALAPGLAAARHLESLALHRCGLGNDGVANLILPGGQVNRSLTNLDLGQNDVQGEEGGRQVSLLLQCFPALKVLELVDNDNLGPLGARALAPGLAGHLESLNLRYCALGNDGVANLIPDGQVNRSLTYLNINDNDIEDLEGGENVIALVARCTNLDSIDVGAEHTLSPEQRHCLDLELDRKCLVTEASALGGSTFPVLFRFVEKAHHHEHGLSAIFVILQNDGDDYFCTALNRAIE